MKFVIDVSGSMYRFNGMDHRMERVMEVAVMLMEAFQDSSPKFEFELIGHSGESAEIPFVNVCMYAIHFHQAIALFTSAIACLDYKSLIHCSTYLVYNCVPSIV